MTRCLAVLALLVAPALSRAIEVQATIRRVDVENARLVFSAPDGRDRTAKVAADAKLLDSGGKELAGGLKSEQLKEGVKATLTVVPEGNQPVVTALRLGGAGAGASKAKAAAKTAAPADPLPKLDTSALVALTDMGPSDEYHGKKGGLYPGGTSLRPAAHEKAGLELARQIRPLDKDGKPAADGKIVLCTIGFSNTSQCSQGFIEAARGDDAMNPRVVIVNGAQGGRSAFMIKDANDGSLGTAYWKEWVPERLASAGMTAAQVQAVWLKETEAAVGPAMLAQLGVKEYDVPTRQPFPKSAQSLLDDLRKIVQILPKQFPNLKLTYVSSRSYGGWALREGNREPFSYETGFAVKWLIEEQLRGDPVLNFDSQKGEVKAPWLSWGPYLWANGNRPRKDGFVFAYDDFRDNDRMHHSVQGMQKMGQQLLQFFKA
ncbi:MAG TPA: hypothetical protein VKH44_10430, partial [Pirellulaceae bacterium]|nr:hypothetical protein [Pirellulaceae bacterium]